MGEGFGSAKLPRRLATSELINGSGGLRRGELPASVKRGLRLLLKLVLAKGKLCIKPRDLALVLGYDLEDPALSVLGRTLAALERVGLAVRHNSSRPRRYTLRPKRLWKRFIEVELAQGMAFQCVTESSSCPLLGLCPAWKMTG